MNLEWKGIFPALTTPFNNHDEIDEEVFRKNLDAQLQAGVNGIVLGGTLGEASVLNLPEKERLVKLATEHLSSRLPVILNIAEGSTKEAIRQVGLAQDWGASGLMLLPPMRYKPDHRETISWFRAIASSTDLPIMIYNNPVDYKTEVTPDMFGELVDTQNIQAVKESTRDVTNVSRMRNRFGNRFSIMCGVDTLAMEELCLGADGWIAGLVCAFPNETVALFNLIKDGEIEKATRLYRWFMPLLELDIHPKLVQYIKLAQSVTGLGTEFVRPPRLILTGEEREQILKVIRDTIARKPF